MQEVESSLVYFGPKVTKLLHTESDTSEVSYTELTDPDVEHPEPEFSQPESPSTILAPTPEPPSPRRKLIVTIELPLKLISIEYVTKEIETPHSPFTSTANFEPIFLLSFLTQPLVFYHF